MNNPPPLKRGYNRGPNIKALKRRGLLIMDLHSSQHRQLGSAGLPRRSRSCSGGQRVYDMSTLPLAMPISYFPLYIDALATVNIVVIAIMIH